MRVAALLTRVHPVRFHTVSDVSECSGWGQVARVRHVQDGYRIYIYLPNGRSGWVEARESVDFKPGDTILFLEDGRIEIAPPEAWPDDSWVSVVRIKNPDTTVVEFSGHPSIVPTNNVTYEPGNTVEVRNSGVVRVLDKNPIKILDFPGIDDTVIKQFIIESDHSLDGFEDFGGLSQVVERARQLIETPLKYRDALNQIGARQVKGILFTGEPGTGKTMLARIIAHKTEAVFYHISGPEIISKWYGQSEELLRKIFEDARSKPEGAIVFFDEIDSIAAQRDEDAHEASRRLVAQLLTLMDGFKTDTNIVVIATTNRPQDIDYALRRPGRFDWEINFPLPSREDRKLILQASARRLRTFDPLPHEEIANRTESWTAAELTAIWTEAAMLAAIDERNIIIPEDYIGGFEAVQNQRHRAIRVSKS